MSELDLTQAEADSLIAMAKIKAINDDHDYPDLGGSVIVPLASQDKRESFLLDISRGRIDLQKVKYQNRAKQVVVLVRLDFGGAPHRNPDGEEVPCPHLHTYQEGFGDKWAHTLPNGKFTYLDDLWRTLEDFMDYCNIVDRPNIVKGLFL